MKELIKVEESSIHDEQVRTVDARQLHAFLGSRQEFAHWVKSKVVSNAFFLQGVDFIPLDKIIKRNQNGGQNRKDYALTLDTAKKVSMAEQTEAGNKARQYFIECEKVAREIVQPTIGSSRKEDFELELIGAEYAAKILRISDSSKLDKMHLVYKSNGIPTTFLPEYTEKVRTVCSATHLLKMNNCSMTTRAFNLALIDAGYLEKKERLASRGKTKPYNSLTEKGLKYGQNDAFKGRSTETQAHYYEDTFRELYGLID